MTRRYRPYYRITQMKFKYIIFDWDGTVMDSAAKIVNCMQQAALAAKLPIPSDDQVKDIIGISLLPAIQKLFSIEVTQAEQVVGHYKHIFLQQDSTPCPLFPNVHETLTLLKSKARLAVATGKARRGLERAWSMTDSAHYFENSRCADEAESKPSPDMLQQLLKDWQIAPQEALMIGDSIYDMQMAEQLDMPRIAVDYGVHEHERLRLHKPIAVISDFSQLHQFV